MAYNHYFNTLTNTSGDSLIGYFARVVDTTSGDAVPIYSDLSGTPVSVVSGQANMAKTDDYGNISLYVDPGTYNLDIYAPDAVTFRFRVSNVSMSSTQGVKGDKGDQGDPGPYGSEADKLAAEAAAADAAAERAAAETAKDAALAAESGAAVARDEALTAKGEAATARDDTQDIYDLAAQIATAKIYAGWTPLAAVTGAAGNSAVVYEDAGTHTDPVVGGTVANAGFYLWSVSPAGWQRVADTEALKAEAWASLETGEPDPVGHPGKKSAYQERVLAEAAAATVSGLYLATPLDDDIIPLLPDANGDAAIWLDRGLFDAVGLGTRLTSLIGTSDNANPVLTSGRHLRRFWARLAAHYAASTTVIKLGMIGDSWTQFLPIPQALASAFYNLTNTMQKSADGWISLSGAVINGATSGPYGTTWSTYDPDTAGAAPTRGCGPDGLAKFTTGTAALWQFANAYGTQLTIYYWNGNGSFRYRVDNGAWTTVASTGANAHAKVTISGLALGTHTVDIDTTVNTGTFELHGLYAEAPARGGILFHQIGNGGARGIDYTNIKTHLTYFAAEFDLDLALILLGINDYRLSSGTAEYVNGIEDIVDTARAAVADASILLIVPPTCGATGTPAQSAYRDAMRSLVSANDYEMVDLMADWGSYAVENAAGSWADPLHVTGSATDTGSGGRIAHTIMKLFR